MLLIVPLVLIGSIVYNQVVNLITDQALSANELVLQQIVDNVDTKFSEITSIATEISSNNIFSISRFRDPLYYYNMRSQLNFSLSHSFLHDMLLYDREEAYFYTSNSSFSLGSFEQRYVYSDWSKEDIRHTLNTLEQPFLRKAELVNQESFISYLWPVPVSSMQPVGVALFLIKEQYFKDMLASLLKYDNVGVLIVDRKGSVVTEVLQSGEFVPTQSTGDLLSMKDDRGTIRDLSSDQPVFVTYVRSEYTGFTYMMYTPENMLLAEVRRIKNLAVIVGAMCILIGGAMIHISMRLNYRPVHRIVDKIEQTWGRAAEGIGFLKIENALSNASKINEQLQSHVPHIRQSILLNALQGKITRTEEFNAKGRSVGLSFSGDFFYVVIIQTESGYSFLDDRTDIYHQFERTGMQIAEVQTDIGLTLIVSDSGTYVEREAEWKMLRSTISNRARQVATIGIGTPYDKLSRLTQSYIEASTALQHKFIYGSEQVIYFAKLDPKLFRNVWQSKELLQTLVYHLERGAADQVLETANLLIAGIRDKSQSLFQAKSVCIEMINTFLWYMREHNDQYNAAEPFPFPDVIDYANFNSVERLLNVTMEVCMMACSVLRAHPTQERDEAPIHRIKHFIHEHYANYHFSLQWMADTLGLSISYVSRIFKTSMDETVMEYVNRLRMEKAKELLRTTQMPVKEIVEFVGYKDASSFIRKFRQFGHLTPLEYRQHHQDKQS